MSDTTAPRVLRRGPPTRPASPRAHHPNPPFQKPLKLTPHDIADNRSTVDRVRDSLRFTLADGVHRVNHEGKGVQEASSYIAGLTATPYWDVHGGSFPWMVELERNFEIIRDELKAGLANPDLERLGNSVWVAAVRDDAEGYGPDWRTLVLQDRGEWEPTNCALFPKTAALVQAANTPSVEVFFAKQAPKTGIKPHTDFTNFIMTSHLGLDVPPAPQSWMKVGEETQYWENGKGMCADTSFIHSTYNESETQDRYVLIIRFWHPELTDHERNGVQFLFDAFDDLSPEGLAAAATKARARAALYDGSQTGADVANDFKASVRAKVNAGTGLGADLTLGDAPAATPAPPAKAAAAPKASKAAKGVAAMIAESKAASNDAGAGKKTKKNKRNKRKGAGAGEGLGLLAKGMK